VRAKWKGQAVSGSSLKMKRSGFWCLVAMAVVVVASCGDDSASDDTTGGREDTGPSADVEAPDQLEADGETGDSVSIQEAVAAYTTCMEAQGVDPAGTADAPSPEALVAMGEVTAGDLPQDEAYRAAHDECWPDLEAVVPGSAAVTDEWPPEDDGLAQQVAGLVACMNDRGYHFAETTPEDPYGLVPAEGASIDWDDPAVNRDRVDCEAEVGLGG
jgi:hypothetical protein